MSGEDTCHGIAAFAKFGGELAKNIVTKTIFGGLMGGGISALTGGDFAMGFMAGGLGALGNHFGGKILHRGLWHTEHTFDNQNLSEK